MNLKLVLSFIVFILLNSCSSYDSRIRGDWKTVDVKIVDDSKVKIPKLVVEEGIKILKNVEYHFGDDYSYRDSAYHENSGVNEQKFGQYHIKRDSLIINDLYVSFRKPNTTKPFVKSKSEIQQIGFQIVWLKDNSMKLSMTPNRYSANKYTIFIYLEKMQ